MVTKIPVSVDIAVFKLAEKELEVLLVKKESNNKEYPNYWALPGGTIESSDSDLDAAAHRTLKRRTNTDVPYLEQVCTEGSATRDPRGWSCTTVYFALVGPDFGNDLSMSDETMAWVPVSSKTLDKLAFDHSTLFKKALTRMQNKMNYSLLPAYFLPDTFVLSELKAVYDKLLGKKQDNSSFRDKMKQLDGLEKTGDKKSLGGKPADVYKLKQNSTDKYLRRNLT